ncbi:competence/damage-inducible protein A [Methylobacter psychrophilus]|uniref:competence/damage-inducible protein A n=1 Tax=Methylobacter psychrophilus TaxID=96941 RepID=UPI0021D4D02F|nr:molybdopterin-binding protein [Methylobacter psychrophilus]
MKPTLEIFSQGEEIVTGQTVDTNAAWLSQQAVDCGFTVTRHTAVGDKLDDLIMLLQDIAQRADCCICTGGLGPTSDDLTAEAVATAFNLPLEFDEVAFTQISRFFTHRNRTMPESNRKQAMLPQGAKRIDNEWGTAPGFSLQYGRCWFAFIPGVPMEMQHLFLEGILPTLSTRFLLQPGQLVSIKTVGLGESVIQERINAIEIPAEVELGFRAGPDEVQTKLLFPFNYPKTAMAALVNRFAEKMGDYVFAIDGLGEITGDLAFEVNKLMSNKKLTLAVVETASQGLLAAKCMGSEWLLSASYEQSTAKLGLIETNAENLITTAKKFAVDLQKSSAADYVLVQLYAGDNNALHNKDKAIIVHNILLTGDCFYQTTQPINGAIKRKQNQAALLTLDLLRRHLQHKTINQ